LSEKTLDTIPQDIDALFFEGCSINEDNLNKFLNNLKELLIKRLSKRNPDEPISETMRMSKLGVPNRKLWYEHHTEKQRTPVNGSLKFLYGDIIEQLIFFLLREAGHTVEEEQQEVVIDGIVGHKDAKVDGYTVDVKSTSSFAHKKFATGQLYKDDPFGYTAQLSAYMYADNNPLGAFIAVNKENGQVTILKLNGIDTIHPPTRIKEIREVLARTEPPAEKCYAPEPMGKSGNLELATSCSYCPFKDKCWKDSNGGIGIRRFEYASGIKELVHVAETPRVPEVLQPDLVDEEGS